MEREGESAAPPADSPREAGARPSGPAAKRGDLVTVHFVGFDRDTGKQFDSTRERNEPFTFELGAGQTVPGFERGVAGMRAGQRRRFLVPPRLAYGKAGLPPTVAPEATLVFVVDMLEVEPR